MNVDREALGLPPIESPKTITITLEEYKELLTIRGRYEELKTMYYPTYPKTNITYREYYGKPTEYESYDPYKVTCEENNEEYGIRSVQEG